MSPAVLGAFSGEAKGVLVMAGVQLAVPHDGVCSRPTSSKSEVLWSDGRDQQCCNLYAWEWIGKKVLEWVVVSTLLGRSTVLIMKCLEIIVIYNIWTLTLCHKIYESSFVCVLRSCAVMSGDCGVGWGGVGGCNAGTMFWLLQITMCCHNWCAVWLWHFCTCLSVGLIRRLSLRCTCTSTCLTLGLISRMLPRFTCMCLSQGPDWSYDTEICLYMSTCTSHLRPNQSDVAEVYLYISP